MWMVQNTLRVPLFFEDLGLSIPPGDFYDLSALNSEEVQHSPNLRLALSCGYLRTVSGAPERLTSPGQQQASDNLPQSESRTKEFFELLVETSNCLEEGRVDESFYHDVSTRFKSFESMREDLGSAGFEQLCELIKLFGRLGNSQTDSPELRGLAIRVMGALKKRLSPAQTAGREMADFNDCLL